MAKNDQVNTKLRESIGKLMQQECLLRVAIPVEGDINLATALSITKGMSLACDDVDADQKCVTPKS